MHCAVRGGDGSRRIWWRLHAVDQLVQPFSLSGDCSLLFLEMAKDCFGLSGYTLAANEVNAVMKAPSRLGKHALLVDELAEQVAFGAGQSVGLRRGRRFSGGLAARLD